MKKYGLRLRDLRIKHGYTQETLAYILNTSRSRIAMYEQGKRQPDFEMQEAIADLFNVSIDYLFGREPKNAPATYDSAEVEKAMDLYRRFMALPPEKRAALLTLLEDPQTDL